MHFFLGGGQTFFFHVPHIQDLFDSPLKYSSKKISKDVQNQQTGKRILSFLSESKYIRLMRIKVKHLEPCGGYCGQLSQPAINKHGGVWPTSAQDLIPACSRM